MENGDLFNLIILQIWTQLLFTWICNTRLNLGGGAIFFYTPPSLGIGKSSFIASVANFILYDVYNFDLSQTEDDYNLNLLLLQMKGKPLTVVKDLDCYISEK